MSSQSNHGKFQNPNKELTNINTQTYGLHLPILARKPYTSLKYSNTNIKIAFRTNNTIQHNLTSKTHNHEKFSATGLCKLTFSDCGKPYIGQIVRNVLKRYNEHLRAFRKNSNSSEFAQHLNEHMNTFGSRENIMQILSYQKMAHT